MLDEVAAELRRGAAVIIPTDTVYGLAALPEHIDVLYELKRRPADMPIAVLVADLVQAFELIDRTPALERLAARYWPGPLTIVAGEHGVRCPDSPLARAVAADVGPIATTSANLHGEPTPETAAAAAALFPDVALVVDGGALPGLASTVVRLEPDGTLGLIREGRIPFDDLQT